MLPRMMRSEEQTTSKWNEKRIMRNKLLFGMSGGRRLRMLILLVWAVMVGIVKAELLDGLEHHHPHHHHHDQQQQQQQQQQHHGSGDHHGVQGDHHGHHNEDAEEAERHGRHGNSLESSTVVAAAVFSCKNRPPGYYADMHLNCEVYHLCNRHGGGMAFECPGGTRFQQRTMVCDHYNQVKCEQSAKFYHSNLRIGQKHLNFIDDFPPPMMQLIIKEDDNDNEVGTDTDHGHFVPPPPQRPVPSPQPTHHRPPPAKPPRTLPPHTPPPSTSRHPRLRPDFMQLVFQESVADDEATAKQRRKTETLRPAHHQHQQQLQHQEVNGFFHEDESDLKPWQRHFRRVFEKMELTNKQQQENQHHRHRHHEQQQKDRARQPVQHRQPNLITFPNFQEPFPPLAPPPPRPPKANHIQQAARQKNSKLPPPADRSVGNIVPFPFFDPVPKRAPKRNVPFPPFDPVPKRRKKNRNPIPFLPLGLVPPPHPLTHILPTSARVLGVAPAARLQNQHGNHPVMSLEKFIREFSAMENVRPVPFEVRPGSRESDVIGKLAKGERGEKLVEELDELIARRTARKTNKRKQRKQQNIFSQRLRVKPRGGKPRFFTSDGLIEDLDRVAATPTTAPWRPPTPRSQRPQQRLRPPQQQSFNPRLEFGFRPLGDSPFFFTTTPSPAAKVFEDSNEIDQSRAVWPASVASAPPARTVDAVRKVKSAQFDMRNLFFIPSDKKSNSGGRRRKKKKGSRGRGFNVFAP